MPFTQETEEWATRSPTVVARVDTADPSRILPELRGAILGVDPTTAVDELRTLADVAALSTRVARLRTSLLAVLAGLATTLAGPGARGGGGLPRRPAEARDRAPHRPGRDRGAGGGAPGPTGSLAGRGGGGGGPGARRAPGPLADHLLFGVPPLDPPVFLGVRALVVVTALLAAWVPAARAFRVEPAVTLEAD